jgi:hypothetical protein
MNPIPRLCGRGKPEKIAGCADSNPSKGRHREQMPVATDNEIRIGVDRKLQKFSVFGFGTISHNGLTFYKSA